MNFKATFCDPFKPDIIELGDIAPEQIVNRFEKIPWSDYLQKMKNVNDSEIHYSPSFEIENKENGHALCISAVGEPNNYEFYIFYKRPKKIKILFGLKGIMKENYTTDITKQTKNDALDCLTALKNNDTAFLSNKIGK